MKTKNELYQLSLKIKGMKPGQIISCLSSIYQEGYKAGHADCCEELGLEDGDLTITISEEELLRRVKVDPSCITILDHFKEIKT